MSTVILPPKTGNETTGERSGGPSTEFRGPGARRRKRPGGTLLLTCAAIVLIAVTAYFALSRARRGAEKLAGPTTYQVVKRSFNVTLNEKGELEATNSVDVKCEVEGRSTIIWLIEEGAEVKKGDLLVKIASNEIDDRIRAEQISVQTAKAEAEAAQKELEIALDQHKSDVRKARLSLSIAEIDLEKYTQGDYSLQLLEKQLALETAIQTNEQVQGILSDSEDLASQGFITVRDLDERRLAAYKAEVEVQKAQRALEVLKTYDHEKNLKQKQSDVEEARKELDRTIKKAEAEEAKYRANAAARQAQFELTDERLKKFLEQRAKTEIVAPADGLVVYFAEDHWRGADRQIAEGSEVYERQTLIQLPDTSSMKVKLRIHEAKTNKIALGQRATVEVEGIPGVQFTGKVTRIAPLADSQNRWLNPNLKEYDTEITMDPTDKVLKPGVTARAVILVREVKDVLAVPVQAVYSRNAKTFAFVGRDVAHARAVEIEVGDSSDAFVEVRSGLEEGDLVLLAQDDTLLAKLPEGSQGRNGPPAPVVEATKTETAAKPKPPAGGENQGPRPGGGNRRGPRPS